MDNPLYQITLPYSEELLKKSIFYFCKRTLGWRYFFAIIAVTIGLITAFTKGDTSWMTGAMAVAFTLAIVFGITLYISQRHYVLGTYTALQTKSVQLSVYEEQFALSSDLGDGSWPWSAIIEIWRYQGVWLVFFARSSYATFPLDNISSEAQAFILQKVDQAGGAIK